MARYLEVAGNTKRARVLEYQGWTQLREEVLSTPYFVKLWAW